MARSRRALRCVGGDGDGAYRRNATGRRVCANLGTHAATNATSRRVGLP